MQGSMQIAGLRSAIRTANRSDETQCLRERLQQARLEPAQEQAIRERALELVVAARERTLREGSVEAFLHEYDLSSREGVLLMCIAEALLRIPDTDTAERLVRDRLGKGCWDAHLGTSPSLLVNASTWGLLLTGRLFGNDAVASGPEQQLKQLVARLGEPVVRLAMQQAMQILARQFVMGRDIREALQRTARHNEQLRWSYDCLGEAALTAEDAECHFLRYRDAIQETGKTVHPRVSAVARPGISIKLSALHPRYEYAQRERVMRELLPRVQALVEEAAAAGIGLTLDAEEADRLELSLDLFEQLVPGLRGSHWQGLGLAVQAYQKRALPVLRWLCGLAEQHSQHFPVRLVKGAYWDSEIKRAQLRGLDSYPVFTRKAATDVSFLACARFLMQNTAFLYPGIASHNALTLAWVHAIGQGCEYEFQRLHGMGGSLYQALADSLEKPPPVRIYAPVGSHDELLPYLVRRLLENGANSSFINQLADTRIEIETLVENPCQHVAAVACKAHPQISLPARLFGDERRNALGRDLNDPDVVAELETGLRQAGDETWQAAACIGGEAMRGDARQVSNPADPARCVGTVIEADAQAVERALQLAAAAAPAWDQAGGTARGTYLLQAADLMEAEFTSLAVHIVREGGRSLADAVAEVREAVDFCRYYAVQAQREFSVAQALPGPTGEYNALQLHGRGVFACFSPWNFPLAIFVGQIAAALAAGNTVLAKPARQTPLTGQLAVQLLYQSGIPTDVLHFLPGSGAEIGRKLCADLRLAGVAFTGSTDTAWTVQQALAQRHGPIVPLIAETGGQNAMLADSSALPEQLVADVLQSAFNSAGQRCSSLRVLFVQEEIAERVIKLLAGAMQEITIGDPALLATDVGPLIDRKAVLDLQPHIERMQHEARLIQRINPARETLTGSFFPLFAFELDSMEQLKKEQFGPILHVIRYPGSSLEQVIDAVNATGYGLTLGVHSRIENTWQRVQARARVGNLYINRNMIGAVVGVQPFGGEGLSGTGPKSGGPYYLHRFATERTLSVNTAAVGGDAGLLSLPEEKGKPRQVATL